MIQRNMHINKVNMFIPFSMFFVITYYKRLFLLII